MWGIRPLQHSFSLPPDLIDVLISAESERDLGICEQRSECLLDTLLAAQSESIHDRAPHYDHGSHHRYLSFQNSLQVNFLPRTPCAPIAIALMMSLPVRMPESNRTVNLPCSCARRTLDDAVIFSRALNEPMAPSTCRPPTPPKNERCHQHTQRAQGSHRGNSPHEPTYHGLTRRCRPRGSPLLHVRPGPSGYP
jgi:hypothetical protein